MCERVSDSFPVYIISSCVDYGGELTCCWCADGESLCWNEWVVRDGVMYGRGINCVG